MRTNGVSLTFLGLVAVLSTFAVSANAIPAEAGKLSDAENVLQGCWKGKKTIESDTTQSWLRCLNENGQYTVRFVITYEGETYIHNESGRWAYSNGIYTTVRMVIDGQAVDPMDRDNQGVYIIETLTPDKMIYKSLRSGNSFKAIREFGY